MQVQLGGGSGSSGAFYLIMDDSRGAYEEHLTRPRGRGALADARFQGAAGGEALAEARSEGAAGGEGCGDLVRVSVRVENGVIEEAGFDASGCSAVVAAGSAVVELAESSSFVDACRIGPDEIDRELGGLAPGSKHAVALAADALHRALGSAAKDAESHLDRHIGGGDATRRTLVAMSGGVDSAVAAQLALDSGDDVLAVTLELWSDPSGDGTKSCCSPQAVTGARALAHSMGIPHITLDLRDEFRRSVVDDFVTEYEAGRTPNPCVRCNGLVRFGEMLTLAEKFGAARLATGHYARIDRDDTGPLLVAAADERKDQTYMLARLTPEQLDRVWFPLAEIDKPQVRQIARDAGLSVADKAESQHLCFLAGIHKSDLLSRLRKQPPKRGKVIAMDGSTLAEHEGLDRFTVGQRRGVGVASGAPLYVVDKDPATGDVTVGPRDALLVERVEIADARLYREAAKVDAVKLRYRSHPVACKLPESLPAGEYPRIAVMLNEPFMAAAPGQVPCFLSGDRVVGHGLIAPKEIAHAA